MAKRTNSIHLAIGCWSITLMSSWLSEIHCVSWMLPSSGFTKDGQVMCWQLGGRSLHDFYIRQIIIADPISAKPGWHSKWIVEPGTKPHTVQEPCSSASGTGQTTGSQAGSSPDHNSLLIQVPDSSPINKIKISIKFVNVISKSKWRRRTR